MKARLRADLRAAMKAGRTDEAKLIRTLVAAIDNAEAPPLEAHREAQVPHRFHDGSAEIERHSLRPAQVQAILFVELEERENAAAELSRLQQSDRADALRAEAQLVRRYIE